MRILSLFVFLFPAFIFSSLSRASTASNPVFKNISSLQQSLGFDAYYNSPLKGRPLKVAVFDIGFEGSRSQLGVTLPKNTFLMPVPVPVPPEVKTEHGLRMAQILTALATDNMTQPEVIKELCLYNVYGFSNFKAAIDDAIRRKIDVISYSDVWEYGGNNDGRGFINAEVTRATRAGIVWVNSAGNYAKTTFNSEIITEKDDWVRLPGQNQSLAIRCEAPEGQVCPVKVVLAWNDFKENSELGTDKDLDLALTDDLLNVVQASSLQQSKDSKEARPGFSKYPREIITAQLKPGPYLLRIKNRSHNFTSKDRLRLIVVGDAVTMPTHSKTETLNNPADNPTVITAGALDSDRSSISLRLHKPDIMTASSVILQNGDEFRGSSNSAAIVAAAVVRAKIQNPDLQGNAAILRVISQRYDWEHGVLSVQELLFGPSNGRCFEPIEWPKAPEVMKRVFNRGGVLVDTTQGIRIMVPFDPIAFTPGQRRRYRDDMILLLPDGRFQIRARHDEAPQGAAEVFQRPVEMGLCQLEERTQQRR